MKRLSNYDLQKNELQNAVIQVLASPPSSPGLGQIYFDSALNAVRQWDGTAWTNKATDSLLLQGQNSAYHLNRANHTGTQTAATISDFDSQVRSSRLDQMAVPTADVSLNSHKLTGVTDPSSAQDAATKNYVDTQVQSAAAGIDSKPSVRYIAFGNVTLSGLGTQANGDWPGALTDGDRILCVGQSTGSQNGPYVAHSGAWVRAPDADQNGEITPGAFWFVEEGTTYGASQWRCNNTGAIVIGTTAISIVQFGASTTYSAGNGLSLTGNVFAAVPKSGGGLAVDGSGMSIDDAVVSRKFSANVGDGSSTSIAITHSLGTRDVVVEVYRNGTPWDTVGCDVQRNSTSQVTLIFAVAPASNAYRVTIRS